MPGHRDRREPDVGREAARLLNSFSCRISSKLDESRTGQASEPANGESRIVKTGLCGLLQTAAASSRPASWGAHRSFERGARCDAIVLPAYHRILGRPQLANQWEQHRCAMPTGAKTPALR